MHTGTVLRFHISKYHGAVVLTVFTLEAHLRNDQTHSEKTPKNAEQQDWTEHRSIWPSSQKILRLERPVNVVPQPTVITTLLPTGQQTGPKHLADWDLPPGVHDLLQEQVSLFTLDLPRGIHRKQPRENFVHLN